MASVVWYSYQETNKVYVSNKCLHITHCNPPFVACFPIPEQYHTFSNLLKCLVSLIVCYVILHHIVRWGWFLCANTHIRCNFDSINYLPLNPLWVLCAVRKKRKLYNNNSMLILLAEIRYYAIKRTDKFDMGI